MRQLRAQRIHADDDRDLHTLRHVIADGHQALRDHAAERRADDRVRRGALRASGDAGFCRLQRLELLGRAVLRRLALLTRGLHLSAALLVSDWETTLIEQRLDAPEFILREVVARLRRSAPRVTALTSNVPDVNPRRASIWAALASASFNCASVSAARRRISSRSSVDWRAALDRRPRRRGRRFRRRRRPAPRPSACRLRRMKPCDRLLDRGRRRDRDARRRRRPALWSWRCRRCRPTRTRGGQERCQ